MLGQQKLHSDLVTLEYDVSMGLALYEKTLFEEKLTKEEASIAV